MKRCCECNLELSFGHFDKDKRTKDGYSNRCNICTKKNKIKKKKLNKKPVQIPEYKICKVCKIEKFFTEFSKGSGRSKDQLYFCCKDCAKIKAKEYRKNNRKPLDSLQKERKNKLEAIRRRKNTELGLKSRMKRKLAINLATPNWLSDSDKLKIKLIYKQATLFLQSTGILHHVDHIVPIQNETVCGLHVPWNLRVIPADENLSKSNKLLEVALETLDTDQDNQLEYEK